MPFDAGAAGPPGEFRLHSVPPPMIVADQPPPPEPTGAPCSCGHRKQAHEHYRAGSDCALCGCGRFHRSLRARFRRSAG
jgi:hypothetical protein